MEDKQIIIRRTAGLGDVLMTLPAMSGLAAAGWEITYVTQPKYFSVLNRTGIIKRFVPEAQSVDLDLDKVVEEEQVLRTLHRVQAFVAIVEEKVGSKLTDIDWNPVPRLTSSDHRERDRLCKKYGLDCPEGKLIAICPDSAPGWPRSWPYGWKLAHAIIRQGNTPVFFSDINSDDRDVQGAIDLRGRLFLDDFMLLLSKCDLVVAVDSGAFHLANTLGLLTVGLFGPVPFHLRISLSTEQKCRTIVLFAAEGVCDVQPCYHSPRCQRQRYSDCMKAITVSEVLKAVQELAK
jgi:ADP-heptose:LPS heptosyltransferase